MKKNIVPIIILTSVFTSSCFIRDLIFEPVDPRDLIKMNNFIDVAKDYNPQKDISNGLNKTTPEKAYNEFFDRVDTLQYDETIEYKNLLPNPKDSAKNIDEIASIFDYYAFYGDAKPFIIKIPTTDQKQAAQAINAAFYKSKLCTGHVGINYEYQSNDKQFVFQFLYNAYSNNYKTKVIDRKKVSSPYSYPTTVSDRRADFNDFGYLKGDGADISVYNSDQLLYALEYGYKAVPIEGSPAEVLLNKAKNVLRGIIKTDMTDNDKIAAIYSYLVANTSYDYLSETYSGYTIERKIFPDYMPSSFRSFYAEGALIDGQATSQGLAKAFNILVNIEGIPSIKVTSRYVDDKISLDSNEYSDSVGATYSSIGYCYTRNIVDGKYYICDPAYSYYSERRIEGNLYNIHRKPGVMLNFSSWRTLHSGIYDRYNSEPVMGNSIISFEPRFKIGPNCSFYFDGEVANLKDYINNISNYVSANNDTNYKSSNDVYQVNLSIGEIEEMLISDPNVLNDSSVYSSYEANITEQLAGTKVKYYDFSKYKSDETALILIFGY